MKSVFQRLIVFDHSFLNRSHCAEYFVRQKTQRTLDEVIFTYNPVHDTKLANVFCCLSKTKQLFIACVACEQLRTAGKDDLYPLTSKTVSEKNIKILLEVPLNIISNLIFHNIINVTSHHANAGFLFYLIFLIIKILFTILLFVSKY